MLLISNNSQYYAENEFTTCTIIYVDRQRISVHIDFKNRCCNMQSMPLEEKVNDFCNDMLTWLDPCCFITSGHDEI